MYSNKCVTQFTYTYSSKFQQLISRKDSAQGVLENTGDNLLIKSLRDFTTCKSADADLLTIPNYYGEMPATLTSALEFLKNRKRSSFYRQDLQYANMVAKNYLDNYKNTKKCILDPYLCDDLINIVNRYNNNQAVIFDVDNTLLNDTDTILYEGSNGIFIVDTNPEIVDILNHAKMLGFKVIIWTGRPISSKESTVLNLQHLEYDLLVCDDFDEYEMFKRKNIIKLRKEYDIILTIGDQDFDCYEPCAIKLPSEEDNCVRYTL